MPANTNPKFIERGVIGMTQVSTANPNRDGTGALSTLITGGANGTLIDLVRVRATGATTAGMIRLFIDDGTNTRLFQEITVSAITPSGTIPAFSAEWTPTTTPFILPSNWSIKVSTENAETFNVFAIGGDY